jgi:hypothetical protein
VKTIKDAETVEGVSIGNSWMSVCPCCEHLIGHDFHLVDVPCKGGLLHCSLYLVLCSHLVGVGHTLKQCVIVDVGPMVAEALGVKVIVSVLCPDGWARVVGVDYLLLNQKAWVSNHI